MQPLDADARAALLTYITSDQAHVRLQDIWWGTRTSLRHERFQYPETYGSYTSIDFDHGISKSWGSSIFNHKRLGGYLEQWDQLDKAVKQCWEWMELNKEDAEGKVIFLSNWDTSQLVAVADFYTNNFRWSWTFSTLPDA